MLGMEHVPTDALDMDHKVDKKYLNPDDERETEASSKENES